MTDRDEIRLSGGLEALRKSMASESAPEWVETKLRAELRARGTRRAWFRWAWMAAAAAAAVVAVVLIANQRREEPKREVVHNGPPVLQQIATPPQEPASVQPSVDSGRQLTATAAVERTTVRARRKPSVRRPGVDGQPLPHGHGSATNAALRPSHPAAADEPEVATDFFVLPASPPFYPEDIPTVVRVELAPTQVRALGLPIMSRADRVRADVLTAGDGIVRAVRFVQ